ncbi:carbohydrate ABC transporter permease [Paenibacillus sp. JDR-2]|uniref:carbohydrate ABC transporter permease n=1 Tax=Paenibacillus sp. (strain JDR-2) TaxID=324057 RepID=UPI000166BA90|nr:carbohydrate ABC transporter permease [Paenibacillus sp. JDR-2]ACT01911.1 binding-protein-dependent transport systems inner membrane component [Paenibacillus sp. JDR-2]
MEISTLKNASGDRMFSFIVYLYLSIILVIVLYPIIFILSSSFSAKEAVTAGEVVLFPVGFSLEGYKAVFDEPAFLHAFMRSVGYTVVGTVINVVITILAAYPLSRKDLKGRGLFMLLFAFTMFFQGGLIPTYLVVKGAGLLNSPWALWLPVALSIWNMIITRTYFQSTIPHDLLEAAQMDGCNDYTFLWKIVLPLSGPIIAVISLFYAVEHWNQYFNALLYLNKPDLYPLQLVLREILVRSQMSTEYMGETADSAKMLGLAELLKYCLIVVSTLPMMIVYPFVQRFFVKGVMIGALKG